jgi:hypothetical protein
LIALELLQANCFRKSFNNSSSRPHRPDSLLISKPGVHKVGRKNHETFNQNSSHQVSVRCFTFAESTENSTFTEMLLASLRGTSYADLNSDQQVSLSELVENARRDMKFAEEQESPFASRGFPTDMVLALANESSNAAIGRRVVVRSEGEWYKAELSACGARAIWFATLATMTRTTNGCRRARFWEAARKRPVSLRNGY